MSTKILSHTYLLPTLPRGGTGEGVGLIKGMPRCENFSSHGRKGIKVSEENPTLYQKDQENVK